MGDTSLGSRPAPAAATVRARRRMRVLLVRRADADALSGSPDVRAALYRSQTESSLLDALDAFASCDGEVAAVDELRRSLSVSVSPSLGAASLPLAAAAAPSCCCCSGACTCGSSCGAAGSGWPGWQPRPPSGDGGGAAATTLAAAFFAATAAAGGGSLSRRSMGTAVSSPPRVPSRLGSFTAAVAAAEVAAAAALSVGPAAALLRHTVSGLGTPPAGGSGPLSRAGSLQQPLAVQQQQSGGCSPRLRHNSSRLKLAHS